MNNQQDPSLRRATKFLWTLLEDEGHMFHMRVICFWLPYFKSWIDKCERFRIGSQDTEAQEIMHIREQMMFSLQ